MSMIKVNAYTGGDNVPSARYRVRQLVEEIKTEGIYIDEKISKAGVYPPISLIQRPLWVARNLYQNFKNVNSYQDADVIMLQREMLSTFYTFEGKFKEPTIFDVDDAIFLYRKGRFAKKIATRMQAVICGNWFLADWFGQWNKSIHIIPTAVDLKSYKALPYKQSNRFRILWSGSSSGYKYLYMIEPALKRFFMTHSDAQLIVMSDKEPSFSLLQKDKDYDFIGWSPSVEKVVFKQAEVGIMPISDDDWSRGKCSYKMLCYMAAGMPVIVSPYGMNADVLNQGDIGYGCVSLDEWYDALLEIYTNTTNARTKGENGLKLVESNYDISVIKVNLSQTIKQVL